MLPFDQPPPTAFYLVLYLVTLVLHVAPMNYVLAGSTYLAGLGVWEAITGRRAQSQAAIAHTLRDWMPLALSVAITMGVAPLLFIQILYKESFYTANLLLFHRWMAILPVLIAAFYLLYVQKTPRWMDGHPWRRLVVSGGVLVCFAFVAWSWTENHLLSTRGLDAWTSQYASGSLFYGDPELPPRLALWYVGAFPTLALIVAWQLRGDRSAARPLARVALATLGAAAVAALVYGASLPSEVRARVFELATPWLVVAGLGAVVQTYGWLRIRSADAAVLRWLALTTIGGSLTTTGMTVAREARRLAAIDITALYEHHAQASRVGGLVVFLLFFVINALLIAGVIALARRGRQADAR